ncbi:MAG: hypothetical protein JKY48_02460 [Flavobacteriales bacterium]|nr:hypothetical protein [Flavobacteriales bacterium]
MKKQTDLVPAKRFATVLQAANLYPAFTASSFRWLIFNENKNGFSSCVKRVGKKVVIDLDAFERWVDAQ